MLILNYAFLKSENVFKHKNELTGMCVFRGNCTKKWGSLIGHPRSSWLLIGQLNINTGSEAGENIY